MSGWVTGLRARRSAALPLELVALGTMLGGVLWLRAELEASSLVSLSRWVVLVVVVCVVLVVRSAPRGVTSPSAAYFITFAMFHCGLAFSLAAEHIPLDTFPALKLWLYRPSTQIALWLVLLGAIGYAIGVRLAHLLPPSRFRERSYEPALVEVMAQGGAVMMVASVLTWFVIALARGGPSVFVASYEEFLRVTAGSVLPFAYYGIDLATVLAAASPWTRWHRWTLAVFVVWAVIAFPLGHRGEILFPIVVGLAMVASRRRLLSPFRAVLIALIVLSAIAAIRQVRSVGVGQLGGTEVSLNPIDGVVELGASLRPVSEVVFWHQMGDPLDQGATYWAPIDRALVYVVPGWTRPPAELDHRIMNVLVMERAGPIGFSTVAEAYRNFASAGVFVVMMLWGLVLGRVDTWPDRALPQAMGGTLLVALLGHVRNSFVPVPSHLLMGMVLVWITVIVARRRSARA